MVLHVRSSDVQALIHSPTLKALIENCLIDGVELIAVVGPECRLIEDVIDEIIVGDGSDDSRYITTSSHPNEALEDVLKFAEIWACDRAQNRVDLVTL